MDYEAFKAAVLEIFDDVGLPAFGAYRVAETVDLRTLDRVCTIRVVPLGDDARDGFFVSGEILWRWRSIHNARTATTEEDFLAEVLGRVGVDHVDTRPTTLRVDIALHGTVDAGRVVPMPAAAMWAAWGREATGRLERIERLATDDVLREVENGRHEILAWQGDPELKVTCTASGDLRLESVKLRVFELVTLPRRWDDPDREIDDGPLDQLAMMARRVKAALVAWVDLMDHFR
jgi:hypothetical protein